MSRKLSEREKAFIREYPIDLCGAAAVRRAGYGAKAAGQMYCQLMEKPEIRSAIRSAMQARAKRAKLAAQNVLDQLVDIAMLDKTQVASVHKGAIHITDTDLLPKHIRRCITEISQGPNGIKIKFDDRVKALELLGRHLALFTDNVSIRDNRPKPLDEMTEEEINAELARLDTEKAAGGEDTGASTDQPA